MQEYSIREIQSLYKSGDLTATNLVQAFLDRIDQIDKHGPCLNAIIEVNPDALQIAAQMDEERKSNGIRSPLHGIPIILKDNIVTADQMMTTAGSLALEGYYGKNDAFIVEQLRKAGAIILGKANLSEWANFRSTHSTSGWSSRGGQTRNPYVLDRTPCGSSSGSAVAVAANLCTVALGTETDGSIICPAQINSLVGIKPTIGLVSRSGIIPIAHSQDTAGPIARSVSDAAILLSALTGYDSKDESMHGREVYSSKILTDYTAYLDPNGLKNARIGVLRNYFDYDFEVDQLTERTLSKMKKFGAILVDSLEVPITDEVEQAEFEVLLYEFKHDLNQFFAEAGDNIPIKNLDELITYNNENEYEVMPFFRQELLEMAVKKGSLDETEYQEARQKCLTASQEKGVDSLIKEHNLDALVAPSGNPACPIDLINGDHFTGSCTQVAAISGYPHITVSMGYIHGLPVGISFIGGRFSESTLIKLAYSFEKLSPVRKPPKYSSTLHLF